MSILRALLFDFDGTLVLSEPLHFAAFVEVLAARGAVLDERCYYDRYLGLTDEECAERMVVDFAVGGGPSAARDLLAAKTRAMGTLIAHGVPIAPGAREFVAAAAVQHPLALVSCGLRDEIEAVLRQIELASFFPLVVAAEDVTIGKPDPQGFLRALRALERGPVPGLRAEQCLVFEDTPNGIAAARSAGMTVVALAHTRPANELQAADLVVNGYADVRWPMLEALVRTHAGISASRDLA